MASKTCCLAWRMAGSKCSSTRTPIASRCRTDTGRAARSRGRRSRGEDGRGCRGAGHAAHRRLEQRRPSRPGGRWPGRQGPRLFERRRNGRAGSGQPVVRASGCRRSHGPQRCASVAVTDLDGDGRKDLLLGNTEGKLLFYPNLGTDAAPSSARRRQFRRAAWKSI